MRDPLPPPRPPAPLGASPGRAVPSLVPAVGVAVLAAFATLVAPAGAAGAQARPKPGTIGTPRPERPVPTPTRGRPGATQPQPAPPAAAARADTARPLPMGGVVWDSVAGAPLAEALVQLVAERDRATTLTARSDSLGRWRIPAVTPGRYLAGFLHPTLDVLGLEPPVYLVEVRPDTAARLDFGTPGAAQVRTTLCPNTPRERGALVGQVRDAESGNPVAGAKVVLTWSELRVNEEGVRNVRRRAPVRVREDGGFLACDLPAETELVANAEAPGRRGGLIEVRLEPGRLVRRDFALGDSASVVVVTIPDTTAEREGRLAQPQTVARGGAALTGTVRSRDGRPVEGARIQLWGSDVTGTSSANGTFALGGLPAGTYALEVRAIGFAPKRVTVDLATRRPNTVAVMLGDRVNTLQSVVVQADRTKLQKDFTGFTERSKRGMGRFVTEADIEKRAALQVTDVLRTLPGLRVVPNGTGFGYAVQGRGNCAPDVFIDGMRVFDGATELDQLVRPQDVAGVEVYNGAGMVPAQFSGTQNACGVVAIWTKRGRSS